MKYNCYIIVLMMVFIHNHMVSLLVSSPPPNPPHPFLTISGCLLQESLHLPCNKPSLAMTTKSLSPNPCLGFHVPHGCVIHSPPSFHLSSSPTPTPAGISRQKLRIFLATDNVLLRSRAIQFLRPFGDVYFSTGLVMHTSHNPGNTSSPRTMVDFYLLGRAAVVYSFNRYISTFALGAALRSNTTLMAGQSRLKSCTPHVEHLAEIVEEEEEDEKGEE